MPTSAGEAGFEPRISGAELGSHWRDSGYSLGAGTRLGPALRTLLRPSLGSPPSPTCPGLLCPSVPSPSCGPLWCHQSLCIPLPPPPCPLSSHSCILLPPPTGSLHHLLLCAARPSAPAPSGARLPHTHPRCAFRMLRHFPPKVTLAAGPAASPFLASGRDLWDCWLQLTLFSLCLLRGKARGSWRANICGR